MEYQEDEDDTDDSPPSMAICKYSNNFNKYRSMMTNGAHPPPLPSTGCLDIRLFYVRIAPCAVGTIPDRLTLSHLGREIGVSLEINGARIPAADNATVTLRRDRVDKESSEVTYVSTDSVRVTGAVEFEVDEGDDMVLCGSLERMVMEMKSSWSNSKTGWSMDCYMASSVASRRKSAFFQPKLGISSPSIEVYIAGCCSGTPVILTKTIQISPRRKPPRHATLDTIPEDYEIEKEQKSDISNGLVRQPKFQITEAEVDDYESDGKIGHGFYTDEMYPDEDGQLSWFNAGVRVGVGIGLGMCIGVGIGVGLLMRSYQTTTRSFRRRIF